MRYKKQSETDQYIVNLHLTEPYIKDTDIRSVGSPYPSVGLPGIAECVRNLFGSFRKDQEDPVTEPHYVGAMGIPTVTIPGPIEAIKNLIGSYKRK